MLVDRAEQGVAFTHRRFKLQLGAFLGGDVRADLHEPGQHTLLVVRGLNFSVDPELAAILGTVEKLDPTRLTRLTRRRGIQHRSDRGRFGPVTAQ